MAYPVALGTACQETNIELPVLPAEAITDPGAAMPIHPDVVASTPDPLAFTARTQ
jgi:hypothetical protein